MKDNKICVMIVEDDSDFTYLIKKRIDSQPDMKTVGYSDNKEQAVFMAQQLHPDIIIMDLNLSSEYLDGIDASKEIRLSTNSKVILLTAFENPQIIIEASKKSFASGYVFKSQSDFLIEMIRKIAQGHTPQEHMILTLILSDLTAAERAVFETLIHNDRELFSSQKTVANQKTNILKKLGLKSQKELMKIFK